MARPRKHPRWQTCESCGARFENLSGHPRRFCGQGCANDRPAAPWTAYEPPPVGTPERAQFDRDQAETQRILDALGAQT